MTLPSLHIATPLGEMLAVASSHGLCLLEFVGQDGLERELAQVHAARMGMGGQGAQALLQQTARELAEYFGGQRRAFSISLDLVGTPFQQRAWAALLAIPFGQQRSYADHARAIGQPTATRAVAGANGRNKVSIVVPCHRVIGSDGRLTGFTGGLNRKRALLALEGWSEHALHPAERRGDELQQVLAFEAERIALPTGRHAGAAAVPA
ncbi:methylated-DNA-[protein]-cysteine S-methyltransferase [Oryzisolibacter propanilivorax]|uniref:Methylated-DNA--protein-cysteine methyltransferase n=1 Tax=Oryzisolibacter propanilivorax TaxID=1527607 RepID=A0A1G9PDH5_9BURK|nr:methylated-DNA--[protein]-cysteine S-methyltransferase [Oryzisolibacter propanilivorax]SDL96799.1 methylated-DNA-[protein]-cysteine S-methyltransferase [Oryzisolibacter propanilivorax]